MRSVERPSPLRSRRTELIGPRWLLLQALSLQSFCRKLNGSAGRRRRRSGIARRRWRRGVTGADLHRPPRIADDPAKTVVQRLGCPIASGSVHRLGVTGVRNVAGRAGGNDRAGDHGTADDPRCNPRPPSAAPPSPSVPTTTPSPSTPLGGGIRRSRGQGGGDRRSREQAGKSPFHGSPP